MASEYQETSDAEKLQEIEQFLRQCAKDRAAEIRRKKTSRQSHSSKATNANPLKSTTVSSYTVDMTRSLPHSDEFPAPSRSKLASLKKKKEATVAAARLKKLPTDPDELLAFYASQPIYQHGLSSDDIKAKTLTLPHKDSAMRIEQGLCVDESVRARLAQHQVRNLEFTRSSGERTNSGSSVVSRKKESDNTSPLLRCTTSLSLRSTQKQPTSSIISSIDSVVSSGAPPPPTRFHKRYPRLCASIKFTDDDLNNAAIRSDWWMYRFMEECYDEAFNVCNTPVCNEARWRLRSGFDLGSMDAFPLVVQRQLAARFSTMGVRVRICIEFLKTLERHMEIAEASAYKEVPGFTDISVESANASSEAVENFMLDGGRATLFSKLLSEEYELDVLAVFLQKRMVLQTIFEFKFKDANPLRIWIDEQLQPFRNRESKQQSYSYCQRKYGSTDNRLATPRRSVKRKRHSTAALISKGLDNTSKRAKVVPRKSLGRSVAFRKLVSTSSRSQQLPDTGDDIVLSDADLNQGDVQRGDDNLRKIVPVSLPNHWHYVHDVAVPESPLISFESGLMSVMCMIMLPQCSTEMRTYLSDRIFARCEAAVVKSLAVRNTESTISLSNTGRVLLSVSNSIVPGDRIADRDRGAKHRDQRAQRSTLFIPAYLLLAVLCEEWSRISTETLATLHETRGGMQPLRKLNEIYQNDFSLMKTIDKKILDVQNENGAAETEVLRLEKALKRLERKRAADIASGLEMADIEEHKEALHAAQMKSLDVNSRLQSLIDRKQRLQNAIDGLWRKATYGSGYGGTKSTSQQNLPQSQRQGASQSTKIDWKIQAATIFIKVIETNLAELKAKREGEQRAKMQEKDATTFEASEERKDTVDTIVEETPIEGVSHRYFIIEVLSKVVVRNALKIGHRKATLHQFLKHQEHQLLLRYGSEEYKQRERDRIQRELEQLRLQRARDAAKAAAEAMSGKIVADAIEEARKRATIALFDPWSYLDDPPRLWLHPDILLEIERRFKRKKLFYEAWRKAQIFRAIAVPYRFVIARRNYERVVLRRIWRETKITAMNTLRMKGAARRIQVMVRSFLIRARFRRSMHLQAEQLSRAASHYGDTLRRNAWYYFRYWRTLANLKTREKRVKFNLTDRRFILTFYIWRDQFFKHKYRRLANSAEQRSAGITIQCAVRCLLARRRVRWYHAQRCIALAVRCYLARRVVRYQRFVVRRVADLADGARSLQIRAILRRSMFMWRHGCRLALGLMHVDRAVRMDKMRRRFTKWSKYAARRTMILGRRATKIQSVVRMWLVHLWVLHYYRWRRGLVAFQGLYRRHLCMLQFEYDIYYYRAARTIQRVYRGHWLRAHINDKRVADIHYAAAVNNYERLLYYVEKFPALLDQVDESGNTPLHIAAANAAKRTLKLLGRVKQDLNRKNYAGYTPLHLTIQSTAINRDECFLYMIDRGFSDEELGPDGKTALLIAVESDRTVIAKHLLDEEDHDPNIPDANGITCLQAACWQGNYALARSLIDCEADVNAPGYGGAYPLHDVTYSGNIDIANFLFSHGAYINVYEPYNYQSPLMWAASAGHAELIRTYLIQGAEVNARDSNGQTAAHFGASSNKGDVYDALREADADFDVQDNSGNTPLHLAAEYGAEDYAIHILHGGGYASWQNDEGDQPSHIAARYNQLKLLQQICVYDEHVGRKNYAHMTPLGTAKFYQSKECQQFLEMHYRMVEVHEGRNLVGDIWWDRPVEKQVGDWEVHVTASAERFYINKITGEVSMTPPAVELSHVQEAAQRAELPLKRQIVLVKEANKLTKHEYYLDYAQQQADIKDLSRDFVNATIINKWIRRHLAIKELKHLKKITAKKRVLRRFIKRHLGGFMRWKQTVYVSSAIKIQAAWRGYKMRQFFYWWPGGEYYALRETLAKRRLRYQLWSMWKSYKLRQEMQSLIVAANIPRTLADWQEIIDLARRPVRVVGVFEEYLYPNTRNIHFYRHSLTGNCVFEKPKKLQVIDEQDAIDAAEIKKYGASKRQINLATKLQAMWRGYKVRSYTDYVHRALDISLHAESDYLNNPDVDSNLYNYALHCLVILQDISRSRRVFVESLRRMQWRGPDIPFVLYAYSIFALMAGDEDYQDVMILIDRARQAEIDQDDFRRRRRKEPVPNPSIAKGTFPFGKCFELADAGFFRHHAMVSRNSFGWQNYAICRFVVFSDFKGSFDAYLEAFHFAPEDEKLMNSFNMMMVHFHGKSKTKRDKVVKERMQHHAQMDADRQEQQRIIREAMILRRTSATKIQNWYRSQKANRIFEKFMSAVRENIRRKTNKRLSPSRSRSREGSRADSRASSGQQQPYARRVNIVG